jgi:hypothetical protein
MLKTLKRLAKTREFTLPWLGSFVAVRWSTEAFETGDPSRAMEQANRRALGAAVVGDAAARTKIARDGAIDACYINNDIDLEEFAMRIGQRLRRRG